MLIMMVKRERELTMQLNLANEIIFLRQFNEAMFLELSNPSRDFVKNIYDKDNLDDTLGEILSKNNKTQIRIAETEKYPHVTFFFNGGREKPYKNEKRILCQSPKVATYDLKPEMSVYEVSERIIESINAKKYDVIICNFANGDMVGHTGNMEAAKKAVEAMDKCIGDIISATENISGSLIITADHGNAELMLDVENNQVHTQHTTNLVPFIVMDKRAKKVSDSGSLSDIAPTILAIMGIDVPSEMTGKNLVTF